MSYEQFPRHAGLSGTRPTLTEINYPEITIDVGFQGLVYQDLLPERIVEFCHSLASAWQQHGHLKLVPPDAIPGHPKQSTKTSRHRESSDHRTALGIPWLCKFSSLSFLV